MIKETNSKFKARVFSCSVCRDTIFSRSSGGIDYCKCGKAWVVQTVEDINSSTFAKDTGTFTYV